MRVCCRYTSQPFDTQGSSQPLDGMVLNPYSMPGGAYSGFNLGMSAVHEAGCACAACMLMMLFMICEIYKHYVQWRL
jgi:hypothetical protein